MPEEIRKDQLTKPNVINKGIRKLNHNVYYPGYNFFFDDYKIIQVFFSYFDHPFSMPEIIDVIF
jgi:hypothetical protein